MRPKFSTVCAALLLIFCLFTEFFCQTAGHIKLHTDRDEWEDSIGLKFVTVTSKDDEHIYFYQLRKYQRNIASMAFDSDTRYEFGSKAYQFTGCFAIHYCKKHLMIYVMQRVPCIDQEKPTTLARNPQ
jgi:hypothetical protein